jgi:hypothetical protein
MCSHVLLTWGVCVDCWSANSVVVCGCSHTTLDRWNRLCIAVMLLTHIWDVFSLSLSQNTDYLGSSLMISFSPSSKCHYNPCIRSWLLPSRSFPFHHTMLCSLATGSIVKLTIKQKHLAESLDPIISVASFCGLSLATRFFQNSSKKKLWILSHLHFSVHHEE